MRSDTEAAETSISPLSAIVGQMVRFGGVGLVVAAVNYAGFLALLALGVNYLTACVLSWLPSVALSYVLNRNSTFRVSGRPTVREAGKFAAAALVQLATAMIGLYLLVEHIGMAPLPASLVNIVIGAAINFAVLRLVVFARAHGQ